MNESCQTAFKEWAVTVDALARGEQIVILRKGGIHERNRHFEIEHDKFLLFPGYLHQDAELLKPDYRSRITPAHEQPDPAQVTFGVYAEVTDVVELELSASEDVAAALEPFHIWAPGFALKRIHWKPLHPLNAIILRCYSLEKPVTMPVLPEYSGCTSWVDLASEINLGEMSPALSDEEFEKRSAEIRNAISSAPATA